MNGGRGPISAQFAVLTVRIGAGTRPNQGIMGKLPFLKFYPADWLRDTRPLSPVAKAAWIDMLCELWTASVRGLAVHTTLEWARLTGLTESELSTALQELERTDTCTIVRNSNSDVTIACRRMVREEEQYIKHAEYMRKYRLHHQRNESVIHQRNSNVNSRLQTSDLREEKEKDSSSSSPSQIYPPNPPLRGLITRRCSICSYYRAPYTGPDGQPRCRDHQDLTRENKT